MFFASNGARFGFKKTIPANIGYHIATFAVTLFIGIGFGWISNEYPGVLAAIKYAGSAYVFYLAWCLSQAGVISDGSKPMHAGFWDGVVLLVLNPKAYLIIGLIFTQFSVAGSANATVIVLWITIVFTLNNMVAFCLWTLAGDRISLRFRGESSARTLNRFFALVLASVAFWMLWV